MTLIGFLLGGYLVIEDSGVKETLYADFPHLLDEPSERVALEESQIRSGNGQASFSGYLMTHNIRVSLLALSLGCFGGVDPLALLFYNGAILGAVCFDYIMAGEGVFLTAWLLPHGIVEIPAILIAGQGGFLLANTLVGRRDSRSLGERFRSIGPDVACLVGGVATMLVWAGIVESFLSQTHEPAIGYSTKIAVGIIEGVLLVAYMMLGVRWRDQSGSKQL